MRGGRGPADSIDRRRGPTPGRAGFPSGVDGTDVLNDCVNGGFMAGDTRSASLCGHGTIIRSRRLILRTTSYAAVITGGLFAALMPMSAQSVSRTLVAVWAHADDEAAAGPLLARYARDGAQVYMIVVTDGAQGGAHTSIPR